MFGEQSNELLEVDESAQVGFKATSCKSGIMRFTNGSSNSMKMYETAKSGSDPFNDPEFPADASSLNWASAGYSTIGGGTPPSNLAWKRVSQMDTDPLLFGKL